MLDKSARRRILEAAWGLRGISYDRTHRDESWKNLDRRPDKLNCSAFVCRVGCEALGYEVDTLAANAGWLLDSLADVDETVPAPGDVVGYWRKATSDEEFSTGPVTWHVMIFLGRNTVLGTSKEDDYVRVRPMDYEHTWGDRRWNLIDKTIDPSLPYRRLELRTVR